MSNMHEILSNRRTLIKEAILDPNKLVVFTTSPAVRVALGEPFGLGNGALVEGKMVSAIRALGADYVFDITFGADLTIMEEANELLDRMVNKTRPLPQFTSCCPAWVKFVESNYPHILPHITTAKSPIGMQGATVKTYFAAQKGIDPKTIVNVALTPCNIKKLEIVRPEMQSAGKLLGTLGIQDTDHVITTVEFANWIKEEGIDFAKLPDSDFDKLMGHGSGAGTIFGNTGGVTEAVLRSTYFLVTGKNPDADFFCDTKVRGFDGIREMNANFGGMEFKVAIVHGLQNAKKIIEDIAAGNNYYHFVEVMGCRGGCVGGSGQPKADDDVLKSRISSLYKKDAWMGLRFSHDNPEVKTVYEKHYGRPLGKKAQSLLHVGHTDD